MTLCFFFVIIFLWAILASSDSATYYGDYEILPVSAVTCSDHSPGLYSNPSWGYTATTLIGQVTQINNGGSLYATAWSKVTGDGDATHCLHCLEVSNGSNSVEVTVIDMKGSPGVDLSDAAFDCLFGHNAHVGGGNFPVTVKDLGAGPCAGSGGCLTGQPASTTTTAPSPTYGTCSTYYTVVSGDTGNAIASKNGITLSTLTSLNPGINYIDLQIGQKVCVQGGAPASSTTSAPTSAPSSAPISTSTAGGGTCTFNLNKGYNFVGYWGQNSGGYENTLGSYCSSGDNTFTAFHIAFMNYFPNPSTLTMNLADHCGDPCGSSTYPGLLCCPSVAADIQLCQSRGKKILLSLGGASDYGVYSLTSTTAVPFADFLWNYFLGGSTSDTRPFGNVVLDGIDLDIENGNSAGYAAFIARLRQHYAGASKQYLISGAPQCVYPDASLGPGTGTAIDAGLDYIVVQFYNNGVCNTGGTNFVSSFNQWASTSSVQKVLVGFLGMSASGQGYVTPSVLESNLQQVWGNSKFAGIMTWDTGTITKNMVGSTSYASQISEFLQNQFACSGSAPAPSPTHSTTTAAPAPTTTAPKAPTTAPTTPSSGKAWSSSNVLYTPGTCVSYNSNYYVCLQTHNSQATWNPAAAASLWQQVNSCPTAAESVSSNFEKMQVWLIPVIVLIGLLFITILLVLRRQKRSRSYSQAIREAEPAQEAVLAQPTSQEVTNLTSPTSPTNPTSPTDQLMSTGVVKRRSSLASAENSEKVMISEKASASNDTSTPLKTQEWDKRYDSASGQFWYYNNLTGVTQWEAPDGLQSSEPPTTV